MVLLASKELTWYFKIEFSDTQAFYCILICASFNDNDFH
jgi:hypothetical protein